MGIFDGYLLCTDLDGTLLKDDKSISNENINAIEYFKAEGGMFTFVTGRMPFAVTDIYNTVRPNAPIGCVNGGGLFDFDKNEYIHRNIMPEMVNVLLEFVDRELPNIGIQINAFNKVYFSKDNASMVQFRAVTGLPNIVCHYLDIDEPVAKIVFSADSEGDIIELETALKSHPRASEFDFIRSEESLYEILPKGTDKSVALEKLCEYLEIDINNSIAMGDYNNDVGMLKTAGRGIAVKNACAAAINVADEITVSNEEDAVARVIYDLEKSIKKSL